MIVIFFVLGAALFAAGGVFGARQLWLRRACSAEADGTVTKLVRKEDNDSDASRSRAMYCPVFAWRTADGREITRESNVSTGAPRFRPGDAVAVRYDPTKPERYYVPRDKTAALAGPLIAAVGALFMGLAAAVR